MKAIKSMLVVAALAVTGVTNAATVATYDVTNSGIISGLTTGSINETGTAVLDVVDGIGTLTVNLDGLTDTAAGGSFIRQSLLIFTGTYSIGTLNITGGTYTQVSCQAITSSCSSALRLGQTTTLIATPSTGDGGGLPMTGTFFGIAYDNLFVAADATNPILTRVWSQNHILSTINRMMFVPSIPIPAAVWLFGTGLFGLAGIARRRGATRASLTPI